MRKWESEPDSLDFESSGLACACRRGPAGAWCGYVGLPADHPWFGKGYSDTVLVPESVANRDINIDKVGAINLFCSALKDDDLKNGRIDMVLAIDVHGGITFSKSSWPIENGLWWIGFDCNHAGDFAPKHGSIAGLDDEYRDLEYVKSETKSLASQLAAVVEWDLPVAEVSS